jgi:RNA polymerase sigma-70 factor (ECF subfamily)
MPAAAEALDLDDATLLEGVAEGRREAFQAFYERHAGRVAGYVRRLCGDPDLAEEIAQETFLAVWQRAGSYSPGLGAPLGWLYTITRNRLVDHWRKRQMVPMAGEDLDKMFEAPIQDNAELVMSLGRALEALNPEQRRVVHMAYFGGLTYEETAQALDVPVGTLKSRIRAALAILRSRLEAKA